MPLAFFTRTQTGALVSRLNNDVLGAQQAFTSTLSGLVSNVVSLVLTAGGDVHACRGRSPLLSLVMLPVFVLPARRIGARLQDITRESYNLNASMNATMTERFNVAGALLVKLFGRPDDEAESFRGAGRAGARHRRHLGDVRAGVLRRAHPGRRARPGAGLRARRLLRDHRAAVGRHGRHAGAAADPALRPAHRAVERPGRRHERAGQLRPRLRGARPRADDRRRARTRSSCRPTRAASSSTTCASPTRPPSEVSLASLEDVAVLDATAAAGGAARRLVPRRAGPDDRARRPVRGRQDDDQPARAAHLRRALRRGARRRARRARGDPAVAARRGSAWSARRRTCSTTRSATTCATRAPDATDEQLLAAIDAAQIGELVALAARGSRHRRRRPRATGSRAARRPGWRSPGCCSSAPRS